jgi:hypothetical protein
MFEKIGEGVGVVPELVLQHATRHWPAPDSRPVGRKREPPRLEHASSHFIRRPLPGNRRSSLPRIVRPLARVLIAPWPAGPRPPLHKGRIGGERGYTRCFGPAGTAAARGGTVVLLLEQTISVIPESSLSWVEAKMAACSLVTMQRLMCQRPDP